MSVQMSRREKLIAIVTLMLAALFIGDRLALAPALAYRDRLRDEAHRQQQARETGEQLFAGLDTLEQRWSALRGSGLTNSAADAESRLSQAVSGWATDADLSLTSLAADRVEGDGRLPRVHVRVAGTGAMAQVVAMLAQLSSAALPVRVQELQLAARRDESERLTVNMRLSTLYVSDQPPASPPRTGRARR